MFIQLFENFIQVQYLHSNWQDCIFLIHQSLILLIVYLFRFLTAIYLLRAMLSSKYLEIQIKDYKERETQENYHQTQFLFDMN